eukprot:TRINITY_DN1159_c0_g1_i11.p1 TRINITY_DN1159_c0_g1~~TRINITY_DN1159_c0_g1_i11.p1  ORF type:complete len:325 (-),score=74.28 TRINITY_DN1159_c0_g1_i11:434-1408(-)
MLHVHGMRDEELSLLRSTAQLGQVVHVRLAGAAHGGRRQLPVAKRTSMFDDPAIEIQELTAVIKQDITALNGAIEELQRVCDATDAANHNRHTSEHSTTVVDSLKSRLMGATKSFKDVLTMRTENLKVHENRRALFSAAAGSASRGFNRQRSNAHGAGGSSSGSSSSGGGPGAPPPPPWASTNGTSSSSSSNPSSSAASQHFSDSSSSRRYLNPQKSSQLQEQQQQLLPVQDGYMRSRAEALQNVESTIVELGTIFQNLAVMVQQQGEVAVRIDADVDDTLANVEGAQAALLKYLNRISSNRWLIIKIFFVLLVFLLIFVTFIA